MQLHIGNPPALGGAGRRKRRGVERWRRRCRCSCNNERERTWWDRCGLRYQVDLAPTAPWLGRDVDPSRETGRAAKLPWSGSDLSDPGSSGTLDAHASAAGGSPGEVGLSTLNDLNPERRGRRQRRSSMLKVEGGGAGSSAAPSSAALTLGLLPPPPRPDATPTATFTAAASPTPAAGDPTGRRPVTKDKDISGIVEEEEKTKCGVETAGGNEGSGEIRGRGGLSGKLSEKAKQRGVFCKSHGGGRKCRIEGCMTSAQSRADVLCIKHGGGKRCMVAGCKKLVRKNNRCTKHASEAVNTVAPPPAAAPTPPVPVTVAINTAKKKAGVAATAAVLTATTIEAAPDEAQAQGDGGLLPPVPSMAREPSPNYASGPIAGGGSRGSFSLLRPPLAAFDDRVSSSGGPMHGVSVSRCVPDGGGHSNGNGNGFPSRSTHNDARLRAPLPGVGSIGSSMLGVDQRGGTRDEAMPSGCCGGKKGGNKALSQGPATGAGHTLQSQARSFSTSPPLEQTSSLISLNVEGAMCMEDCGQAVQQALREVPGVHSVKVDFPTRTASVKVDTAASVAPADLTAAVEATGFTASCITSTTTEEPTLRDDGVNAVWAIANASGLVDRGCAMAWGDPCSCGDGCQRIGCPYHGKNIKDGTLDEGGTHHPSCRSVLSSALRAREPAPRQMGPSRKTNEDVNKLIGIFPVDGEDWLSLPPEWLGAPASLTPPILRVSGGGLGGEYQYVGPQLKATSLRAASSADALEQARRPAGRRTASRAPILYGNELQVSYARVDYSCGDWFSDMCQSVFWSGATAHQPLQEDPRPVGRRTASRAPIPYGNEPPVSYACVDYSCRDWFSDMCQSVFRGGATAHRPPQEDPNDLMCVDP
eukprot:g6372.t1